MRKAVIDLGTNTFHLLVAERDEVVGWRTLLRHRVFVKLAEEGMHFITPAAFERGLRAMDDFRAQLDAIGIPLDTVRAYGTAALRTAHNAEVFLAQVRSQTSIPVRAISGDEEAFLIYLGVRQAVPWPEEERVLIMDIGGGSVEFILADRERVFWQRSFPVGVAVLFQAFHRSDPIASGEIEAMTAFLEAELAPLWHALAAYQVHTLVGAAGAFDTIDLFALDPATKPSLYGYLPAADFEPLAQRFVRSTVQERMVMPRLIPERLEMIVAAIILIRFILTKAGIKAIYTSEYSMKEGMLVEEEAKPD